MTRHRHTRRGVKLADAAARGVITAGGIGTIIAVSLVCLFLVWVAVPLFFPARIDGDKATAHAPWPQPRPMRISTDEYRTMTLVVQTTGELLVYRSKDGTLLTSRDLFDGEAPTAAAFSSTGQAAAFGFADGHVVLGEIGFAPPIYLEESEIPPDIAGLDVGRTTSFRGGIVTCTPQRQFRLLRPASHFDQVIPPRPGSPVLLLDLTILPTGPLLCVLTKDHRLSLSVIKESRNMLTGEVVRQASETPIPYPEGRADQPIALGLSGVANMLHLIWADGRLIRYDLRDRHHPQVAETGHLLQRDSLKVTAFDFLIGKGTFVVGDSSGRVSCWFPTKPGHAITKDGVVLARGHEFLVSKAPITALAASRRSRLLAAGHEDGTIDLYYVTNDNHLATLSVRDAQPVSALAITPKDDGLVAATARSLETWAIDLGHPDVTVASLFRPVWYEGRERPAQVWQSSSGTDDFEAKLGLWPLIFGTIKGTIYCLLFGVPLALLAAIYTSEFLHPKLRARIKPIIELMASLPSVVLGFLAALVVAPFVENVVPAAMTAIFLIPVFFLAGGHLWQMLPGPRARRLERWRLLFIAPLAPAAIGLAALTGPLLEKLLFANDIKLWADGQIGRGAGAWILILVPAIGLVVALATSRFVNPWLKRRSAKWTRARTARASLVKFICGLLISVVGAVLAALVLDGIGLDPRGSIVDTYVQRNAMIVGFMMGFAIIPIIYTIAEDALSTVPEHLRSASLAAGATRWQTALRVIVPTAMSGLFSAVMIGIGRAVGETMIVLMAAGNTPIMEWNIFNGFRTLSANIATELPEAVAGSSHYRTLFLAALVLFAMTFVLNTAAEVIRQRFRRRAYEL